MKLKTLLIIAATFVMTRSPAQEPTLVYLEVIESTEAFAHIGDTLSIRGSDYGKPGIEKVIFILKDRYGSYSAEIKYQGAGNTSRICYKGSDDIFESVQIPVYNENGELIETKEYTSRKPVKIKNCD